MKINMFPKLLVVFLLVAVIPFFASGYYFARQLLELQQQAVEELSRMKLQQVCAQLNARIAAIDDSLQLLSREMAASAEAKSLMRAIYRQHPEIYSLVYTAGPDNRVREAVLRYGFLPPGASYGEDDAGFWRRKMTLHFWNLEPQLAIAYRLFDPVTGKPKGILWADVSLKSFFTLVNRPENAGVVSYVVTVTGKIVSHPDINLVLSGKSIAGLPLLAAAAGNGGPDERRSFFYRNLQGTAVLGMISPVPGFPLLVVREVPRKLVDLPYVEMKRQILLVAAVCLFLLVFFSWIFSLVITRPLQRLNNGIGRIISGDYRFSLRGFPRDEIGDLADKFNQMVKKLQADRQRRQRAEEELRESEKRYRMVANFAYDMECWRDNDGRMIYVSPSCENLTGYSPAEFLADPRLMEKLVLPEDRNIFIDHKHEMSPTGIPQPIEFRIRHRDGRVRWFNHICRPVYDDSGENLGVRGSNRDVTEQKLATESLAAEREKLTVTLRSIADGVITVDNQSRVVMLNQAAEKMTGWPQSEAAGRPLTEVFQVVSEHGRRPLPNPVAIALREKRTTELLDNTLLISRDGRQLSIGDSAAPIISLAGETIGAVLVFRDLTEKRRLQAEMRRADKIESIGLLAGGIAHDFNNLLQGIRGSLSLSLARGEELPPPVIRNLQRAEEATRQASALAQQLLTFSRGGDPQISEVDLQPLIVESANFVLHGSNVVARYEFAPDLDWVLADSGQIGQVVHNLVLNAKQAMDEGGVINIRAENFTVVPDEHWYGLSPGPYVKITVHDHGTGIDKEIIDKVFDPYFTTKSDGRGLGLATCYSIVKNHGGHISISSVPGEGTTFVVFLPAIPAREAAAGERKGEEVEQFVPAAGGGGRVLVMDDEELIREIACEMLEMAGYRPTAAADGREAVERYRQAQADNDPFDVVISDLTVPGGMGGQEMAREILSFDAEARIIVSSGYASDAVLANYRREGFVAVINKPYKMAELISVLQQVLGG